jgi:hypothetical protein
LHIWGTYPTLLASDLQRPFCSRWLCLNPGIFRDRLYLSYAGDLKPELQETLETLKLQSQSEASKEQAKAVLFLAGLLSDFLFQPPKITH